MNIYLSSLAENLDKKGVNHMRKKLEEKIYAQGYPDAPTAPIVSLEDFFEGNDDEEYWAFSERVYILTNANISEVEDWVEPLELSEIDEGYAYGEPPLAPNLKEGYKVLSVWWD